MTVVENLQREKKKGKKPPTFQHLPRNRAAKLKKDWIEKAKVRKQWKHQKRREEGAGAGAGVSSPHRDVPPHLAGGHDHEMDVDGERSDDRPRKDEQEFGELDDTEEVDTVARSPAKDRNGEVEETRRKSKSGTSTAEKQSLPKGRKAVGADAAKTDRPQGKKVRFAPTLEDKTSKTKKGTRHPEAPRKSFKERMQMDTESTADGARNDQAGKSLRELTRAAYLPNLQHSANSKQNNNNNRGNDTRKNRVRHPGSTAQLRKGKGGQPNLGLRMEAMLEKIKRDYP